MTYLNMNGLRKCFFLFSGILKKEDVPWGCATREPKGDPREKKAWESRPSYSHREIL